MSLVLTKNSQTKAVKHSKPYYAGLDRVTITPVSMQHRISVCPKSASEGSWNATEIPVDTNMTILSARTTNRMVSILTHPDNFELLGFVQNLPGGLEAVWQL